MKAKFRKSTFKKLFGAGVKVLSKEEATKVDLGPLTQLLGKWSSPRPVGDDPAEGWNVIAVPGPTNTQGFTLEVIPYMETWSFSPVVVASNRGAFKGSKQTVQLLSGLIYEQKVTSVCDSKFCTDRGFGDGQEIHAETGLFLNMTENPDFNICRLSTIPHGNSVLALGQSFEFVPKDNSFIQTASTIPTTVQGGNPPLGYSEIQYDKNQFANFDQRDPNSFLKQALGKKKISAMTTLAFSTEHPSGGILNVPFIKDNVNTTSMNSTFWIETIKQAGKKPDLLQLQYTQTINIVFPPTGSKVPFVWPHVTINTMTKESDPV
ncbi:MAG: heme-binding protein [Saprospiraceae bacterium]